jgi:hypothetical protein
MRNRAPLAAAFLASTLAACGDGGKAFEADFATAKANAATAEGGTLDRAIGRIMATPENQAGAVRCITGSHHKTPGYRGVMEFTQGGGYTLRFEADDRSTRCLQELYGAKAVPEPPVRPYLLPVEIGVTR